ncbi:MAG TPA: hypothetical protein VNW23_03500 [Opitutaceae bacterium]|jgi:hypothetical protein|nr:hypothetical protein [Opitutaceae bacterium]
MASAFHDEPASSEPSRVFARHKTMVLRTLLAICESLRRLQSEAAARQACLEVAALLRDELKMARRRVRD